MARVVEAVQIFKKVEDVTAAKDDPAPVYLMDELAEMSRGSAESSEKIADRIAKRLQNKSPVVKFKAVRLIRHLVNKGCGQFQRSMQRHANLVRELTHFTGEPDPYKGDIPNQRVRDAAKEASEALFNTVMAQPVTSLGSRIQGFGSSAALPPPTPTPTNPSNHGSGAGSGQNVTSSNRMVGFGSSSNYTAPTAASSGNGTAGPGASSFAQKGVNRPLTGTYGDGSATGAGATSSTGGYAAGGGGYTAPAVTPSEVLGSEAQLVDSICTPGGLRLAPDPEDLRRFVEAAGNLDGLKLAELLRDKMDGSGPWQQQLRALYAVEAVLLHGATQACGEIAVMFQSDPGPIQAATGHTQAVVRERAGRVLKLLLGGDTGPAAEAPVPVPVAAPAPQTTTVDLLGGGLDMLGSPVQSGYGGGPQQLQTLPPQQPPRPATGMLAGGSDDMFSGLALGGAPSMSSQQHTSGLKAHPGAPHAALQRLQQQPQQQQGAAPATTTRQVVDPFGLGYLPPSTAPPPPSPPQPQLAYARQQQQPQQQNLQWQQAPLVQQQNLSPQQASYAGRPGVGVGMQQQPMGLSATGAPHAKPQSPQPVAQKQQPQQGAGCVRPPLDEMFADMSFSSSNNATGWGPGAGSAYAGVGNDYGVVGSHAYGSALGGGVGPTYGGGMGYGNPSGGFSPGTSQAPMLAPSSNGMGLGPGGTAQHVGPHTTMGALPHTQAQQHMAPPPPSTTTGTHTAALGSADARGDMIDLMGSGPPTASGAAMVPGAWPGHGVSAGAYGTVGIGAGRGPAGGLGMGTYPGVGAGADVASNLRGVADVEQAIPGARETFLYFRERQIPWLFVTNTNTKNREGLAARLQNLGIPCSTGDIISPAKLAADWLRAHDTGPTALFVAPELSSEFEGIPLLPTSAESGAAAVVIGDMGLAWNYSTLNRAFRLVMEARLRMEAAGLSMPDSRCGVDGGKNGSSKTEPPLSQQQQQGPASSVPAGRYGGREAEGNVGAPGPLTLISLGKGRYYKDIDGYSLDVGPFTAAIEFAADVKAVVLGKPDPLIFCLGAESLGLKPGEAVMIGDDVFGDVGGAQAAGLQGVLVRTGKFREHDLNVGVVPDAVLHSIADLPTWWGQQQQRGAGQEQELEAVEESDEIQLQHQAASASGSKPQQARAVVARA